MKKIEKLALVKKLALLKLRAEEGMATAEYAIVTLAAAAFAGVLLVLLKGGAVKQALQAIIETALSVS